MQQDIDRHYTFGLPLNQDLYTDRLRSPAPAATVSPQEERSPHDLERFFSAVNVPASRRRVFHAFGVGAVPGEMFERRMLLWRPRREELGPPTTACPCCNSDPSAGSQDCRSFLPTLIATQHQPKAKVTSRHVPLCQCCTTRCHHRQDSLRVLGKALEDT